MTGTFLDRLAAGTPLLLDSAMGSELDRRGADVRLPLWSARALVEAPDTVLAIHRENVDAGADILTANTFRTQARTVGDRAAALTARAIELAREAGKSASRVVFVAGSIAPLADCYRPDLVPEGSELEREHREHARNLAAAGVDFLILETMNSVRELVAATGAASATGLPVVLSMVTGGQGALLSGESLEAAVRAVLPRRPSAIGVNCVDPPGISRDLVLLAGLETGVPLVAYGNVLSTGEDPEAYADAARRWISAGTAIVGGCCGTTPAHTRALRELLDGLTGRPTVGPGPRA